MAVYSRTNPSPRFRELVDMYRQMHTDGAEHSGLTADETFSGISLGPHLGRVKRLIEATGARNLLDYGSGKGQLYDRRDIRTSGGEVIESVQDFWDVDYVHLYDPGYAPFSKLPEGTFGGVICTDVLEHCPEEDLPWLMGELFGYAEHFVFMTIASYPAAKILPNGENAHITIRPAAWWRDMIVKVAGERSRPGVTWEAWVEFRHAEPDGKPRHTEQCIRGRSVAA
jgi:hypothetical protein